jgi:hypothetical protein
MKKIITLLFASAFLSTAFAQQSVKKYVLMEHFTNTKCPICYFKNPDFYALIQQYPNDIHHISIHPPVPYNTCVLYLANTTENTARSSYYGIPGTPEVAINGNLLVPTTPLLSADTLQHYLGKTSPMGIQVTETGTTNRNVAINAHAYGTIPAGNYKLYAFIVEKTLNYNAPNGETVHYDVFRKAITSINGLSFNAPAAGQTVTYNLTYTLDPSWQADQVYVTAFIQNVMTKEILNSGTRFDPVVSATGEAIVASNLTIFPNPASETATVQLKEDVAATAELFSLDGRLVLKYETAENNAMEIPVAGIAPGIYFVKVNGKVGVYSGKLIKE